MPLRNKKVKRFKRIVVSVSPYCAEKNTVKIIL